MRITITILVVVRFWAVADVIAQNTAYADALRPVVQASCTWHDVGCGTVSTDTIGTGGCSPADGRYSNVYRVNLAGGTPVFFSAKSSVFTAFVGIYESGGSEFLATGVAAQHGSAAALLYQVPHDGFFYLEVRTLELGATGLYSYLLTCTSPNTLPFPNPSCSPSATTLCLASGRFAVTTQWRTNDGGNGAGQAVPLTSDTGYFTFFSASNVEVVVKVLSGCGLNSRYWVFAGGLTNVNVVMTVRDTKTNTTKTFTNPVNTAFTPIQDTNAFATCP
jgi:hypothetical protein